MALIPFPLVFFIAQWGTFLAEADPNWVLFCVPGSVLAVVGFLMALLSAFARRN